MVLINANTEAYLNSNAITPQSVLVHRAPSSALFSGNAHIWFDYKLHTTHSFHALYYFFEQLLCIRESARPALLPLLQL